MEERIQYPEGQCVIVHNIADPRRQELGEIVTNPFTNKQIIDMDSGVISLDKDLPDGVYYILIPAEERETMWAILNDCYDKGEEISQCMNCNTKISLKN